MPWIEARLRGQKVLARANADGSFVDDGGRVEIRYKASDPRAYRAATRNLEKVAAPLLPDDHCVSAELVAPRDDAHAGTREGANARPAAKKASAPKPPPAAAKDAWIAYTDGACTGNPGPAGAGFIVIAPDGKIGEGYESLGIGTNNIAELTAILRAAEAIPLEAPEVVIHTDSKYAIGVLAQGWKAKANQTLIAQTKRVLDTLQRVRFVYVPGHAGIPLNERADELARQAIRSAKTQRVNLRPER
jgi:ribonuclease HI